MCINHRLACSCGQNMANLMFRNHVLPPTVIRRLCCPRCSACLSFDSQRMIADNGWVLEFDMELAGHRLQQARLGTRGLSPGFLFDEGYASWNGLTPTELEDRLAERQEIIALSGQDMHRYLTALKNWGCQRVQKLRDNGWRKARNC